MLHVNHLYKSYHTGSATYEVLKDVNLTVEKGEFVAVMGPSGSGKTTLLNCISCFIPHDSGEILLNGTPLENLDEARLAQVRSKKLGFVFQDFCLLDGLTVFENICIPKIILHSPYKPMEAKAQNLMELFDITDIADKYPAEISGGQKQRTAVASHCDRVLLMRDGQVQKELKRQGSRREFMDILLDELKQLNERM